MFQAINMAFSEVYGTRKRRSGRRKAIATVLVFVTVLLALLLIDVVGVLLSFVIGGLPWGLLSVPLLFGTLFVTFLPMYYRFPGAETTIREATPGAAFTAGAWTVSGLFFRVYASTSDSIALYGVAGAALLVLTWLYLGGLILLLRTVLNAVLAGRVDANYGWLPTDEG